MTIRLGVKDDLSAWAEIDVPWELIFDVVRENLASLEGEEPDMSAWIQSPYLNAPERAKNPASSEEEENTDA